MRFIVSLALVVACSDPALPTPAGEYTLRALGTQGGLLETGVVSGCLGIRGRIFSDAVEQTLSPPANGAAISLELPAGTYGIAARVVDPMCQVIAFACIDVELIEGGSDDFTLELQSISDGVSVCGPAEACLRGRCGPSEPDAGSPDAGRPDAGPACAPGEHLDCFRDRFCIDGVVGEIVHAPQPCDAVECPWFFVGTCPGACATREPLDEWSSWEVFCEGTQERIVGDACATDENCQPPAPILGRVYLGCDLASSLCEELPPPEAPDLGAPCSIDLESVGGPGSYGVAPDGSCTGGLCRFYRPHDACAPHGCGLRCDDDWGCPLDYDCDLARDWSIETDTRILVCLPSPGSEVGRLSCHEDM